MSESKKRSLKTGRLSDFASREFGLDAEPLLILALGKGIEKIELTEIGSDGDRAYYRKNGTHYVPKVRLEDLLIG